MELVATVEAELRRLQTHLAVLWVWRQRLGSGDGQSASAVQHRPHRAALRHAPPQVPHLLRVLDLVQDEPILCNTRWSETSDQHVCSAWTKRC